MIDQLYKAHPLAERPRFSDWPERLCDYVTRNHNRPFQWGTFDCCLFAADVFQVLTGVDPAAQYRGAYSTAREAVELVTEAGGVQQLAASILAPYDVEVVHPNYAQRGDIVLVEHDSVFGAALRVPRPLTLLLKRTNASWR